MIQCTKKHDILTLQCLILSFTLISYITLMSLQGILINLPLLATLIVKIIDRNMRLKNTTFHYDLLFVVNVFPILFFDSDVYSPRMLLLSLFLGLFIFSLSIVEMELYSSLSNYMWIAFVLISLPIHIFGITVALFICLDWWNINLQVAIICILYKFVFVAHTFFYKKEKGVYNSFLIELGGGDSVMKKNVGYHIIVYQMKISIYYIVLPLYLCASFLPLQILMMATGTILQGFFTYVALKDASNIRGDNETINEEERQRLQNNIGISSEIIDSSI